MIKPITKDRLKKAIATLDRVSRKAMRADMEIMQSAAAIGMKSVFGLDVGQEDLDKLRLILLFHGEKIEPETIDRVAARQDRQIDRFKARRDRILNLQEEHGISGLILSREWLGENSIKAWEHDDDLVLTDDDMKLLREQKPRIFAFWLQYCLSHGLTIYRRCDDGWAVANIDVVRTMLACHDWATVWERIAYISPRRMRLQGFDTPRGVPEEPDDERIHEVSLLFIDGKNRDSIGASTWFCACNRMPSV